MRIALALICLAATPAFADEDVTIPCQTVVQYTNNSSIPATVKVTYNVYTAAFAQPKKQVATAVAACPIVRPAVSPGSWCWDVTATTDGAESAHSVEFCKVVAAPKLIPKAPEMKP